MTLTRATALGGSLLGAFAIGFVVSPHFTNRLECSPVDKASTAAVAVGPTEAANTARQAPSTASKRKRASRVVANRGSVMSFTPELEKRLQSLLSRGIDLSMASEGFRDPEQFATVAHVARNLDVPFMVLKHAVVDQGRSLTAAIHMLKPEANAPAQVSLARAEASVDFASAQVAFANDNRRIAAQ
jgi:hypothetical protein